MLAKFLMISGGTFTACKLDAVFSSIFYIFCRLSGNGSELSKLTCVSRARETQVSLLKVRSRCRVFSSFFLCIL